MLPFGLKAAWFALSLTGTLVSIPVLIAFSQAINAQWVPLSYFLANSVLQGAFLSGMVWGMDPFLMPRWFCISQTIAIGLGSLLVTSVCTSFAVATSRAIYHPFDTHDCSILRWRPFYWWIVGVFPACASAILITVVIKFNAAQPSDDLHCDISNPTWPRFLSYAGVPMLQIIPCFLLTTSATWRLYHKPRMFERVVVSGGESCTTSPPPPPSFVESQWHSPSSRSFLGKIPPQSSATLVNKTFSSPRTSLSSVLTTASTTAPAEDTASSSTSPRIMTSMPSIADEAAASSRRHPKFDKPKSWLSLTGSSQASGSEVIEMKSFEPRTQEVTENTRSLQIEQEQTSYTVPASNFGPAIWRLLWFQFAFSVMGFQASLSTVIDVAEGHKRPTPFGTQHIALLCAAWGPSIFWIQLPGVQRILRKWLRQIKPA